MFNFKNKKILVTAGSYGLGRAIVDDFLKAGAQVVTCSRSEENLKELALTHLGQVFVEKTDLTDVKAIEHFVKSAIQKLGGLDVVVFNPPHSVKMPVGELHLEDWKKSFDAIYTAMIATVSAVLPELKNSKIPSVVVISSIAAIEPIDIMPTSSVLRGGIAAWVKLMSREYGPQGIRFNAVMPGFTETPAVKGGFEKRAKTQGKSSEELIKEFSQNVPLRRMGTPHELANAVLFLASELASYITGTTLLVDGGASRGI